ncbi:MAG TPA: site-specific DNA-methyltransferase [Planctomycetota bacterium]|nr:site-specific DNA-methyltransferase [Planctomycetota bacterium]
MSNLKIQPEIREMPLADLQPASYNPRKISDQAYAGLRESLQKFGCVELLVVNKRNNRIVAGHQRFKVLQEAGVETATVVLVDLDEISEQMLNVTLNNQQIAGEFTEALAPLLEKLRQAAPDDYLAMRLEELRQEVAALLPETPVAGQTDPDDVPEPPDEAITRRGDIWVLGSHRLMCGDSASAEDLDRLLAGKSIDLVNTDPPYNVAVEPRSNNACAAGLSSFADPNKKASLHHQAMDEAIHGHRKPTHRKLRPKDRPLTNDFVSAEDFQGMLDAWFGNIARVLKPGGSFYLWGGYANLGNYPGPLKKAGLYFSQGLIWDKEHPVLTRKDFMGGFEICFYGWAEGAGHNFYGPNNVVDIWHVKKINPQSMIHLTEKPSELAVRAMQYSSLPGENVLDLFGGSGSTLIAAEQTGRNAFLMEIDELYCDVIVKRWEEFTGRKAERLSPDPPQGELVGAPTTPSPDKRAKRREKK